MIKKKSELQSYKNNSNTKLFRNTKLKNKVLFKYKYL